MSTFFFILPFFLLYMVFVVYAERKISAFMQDRLGPMEVGYYGLLQTVADLLKLLQKEDIVPRKASPFLFKLAPLFIFLALFTGFAVVPLSPQWPGAALSSGVFLLMAVVSLDVIGLLMAGWSSNNKYSVLGSMRAAAQLISYEVPLTQLGSMRAAAQLISYEVPLTLAIVTVAMVCQTLDLQEICFQQSAETSSPAFLLGIPALGSTAAAGGFLTWNVFRMPLLLVSFLVFFISSLAESNRAPFDLPEAESELVAGYQTEYSGFRWAILMLSEYGMMLLTSMLAVILFFGGWNTPLPNIGAVKLAGATQGPVWGILWLVSKTLVLVCFQIVVRWAFPRLRVDQLMTLSWKYLTPLSLILILLCGLWRILWV